MTLRSSFFKLLKEDLRQRLWTIVLAAIAFVLPIPIYIAMEISSSAGFRSGVLDDFARRLASPLGAESVWLILVTIVGASICAVSGFGYLFSKKKVDFFHSLPVKREMLFAVRYINGVLIYLVPYLVMVLTSIVIIAVTGNLKAVVFPIVFKGLAVHLLGYLTIYTTLILCVTFVGNIVVFFAVSGWTFGITVAMLLLYSWFEEQFFDTFSYMGNSFMDRLHSLRFLCPGYFYLFSAENATVSMLLQQLVFTAVLVVITLLVYRMRPSDGAGRAIAFPVLKPVIRISVELLAGALIGMLFYSMADNGRGIPGWMIFGAILGVVLSHVLIQSIFHFDIRKCFADKWSMGVCIVASTAFTLGMRYDVFGYDTYLPRESKIESVAVDVNGFDRYRSSYNYGTGWIEKINEMELTDIKAVYPYLETLVEDTDAYWSMREDGREEEGYIRVNVAYRLENGKTVYRVYRSKGMREEVFAPVFESPEYKEIHYVDVYTVPEEFVDSVTARHAMNEQIMSLSSAEKTEFMAILRRELSALTLKEKLDTLPVAILALRVVGRTLHYNSDGKPVDSVFDNTIEVPIYASFTETLRFLKERGFAATAEYEWTGKEMMRLELPNAAYKEQEGGVSWPVSYNGKDDAYVALPGYEAEATQIVTLPEDWDYGYNVIPVEPEDQERLYALCTWEALFDYGSPLDSTYNDYKVFLDVPREGYNMYETYSFVIPEDADLSFLFN